MSKYLLRTIIRPYNYSLTQTVNNLPFSPKSLVLLNTPQLDLSHQIDQLSKINKDLQIINASLDSNTHSKVEELWLPQRAGIKSFELQKKDKSSKNWAIEPANIELNFQNHHKVCLRISNSTLFYTELPYSMSFIDSDKPESSRKNLSSLSLSLPFPITTKSNKSFLIPLKTSKSLTITKSAGNLILQINNTSASSFLINALQKEVGHKQVQVFATIKTHISPTITHHNTYEVIAGGGEWGPKANALVLEGAGSIGQNGNSEIEFSYVGKVDRIEIPKGIYFENVLDDELVHEEYTSKGSDIVQEGVLGLGSVKGFEFDGINYKTPGEVLVVE